MHARIPLIVAVVGALLIGGATTGSTLASWRDQETVAGQNITAGEFDLNVNGGGKTVAISLGTLPQLALNFGSTPGAAQAMSATLNYKVTGKNNRMRLDLTGVTANQTDLTSGLEAAASTVAPAATCPSPATGYKPLSADTTTNLNNLANASGSVKLCLSVRVKANAPAAVGGKSGALTLTLVGTQVAP